jgi:hypothetical protein
LFKGVAKEQCASTISLDMLKPENEEFTDIDDAESFIMQHYTFRKENVTRFLYLNFQFNHKYTARK